jgi:uncharacterized protein
LSADAHVSALTVYPVKSARPVPVAAITAGPRGWRGDREWMLVDAQNRFVSQRSLGRMAQLVALPITDGIELTSPAGRQCRVSTPYEGEPRRVDVWGDVVGSRDAGDLAAAFLSDAFGRPLRLVWMPPETHRPADPVYTGSEDVPVSFADGYPVLVASEASLADLNRRLPTAIEMARFRPNVVIRGWEAFAEDSIRRIRCGDVELTLVKPCTRCIITTLDPRTGEAAFDPTPVLKSYRFDRTLRGVTFGVNAVVTAGVGAQLAVGAPVTVLA